MRVGFGQPRIPLDGLFQVRQSSGVVVGEHLRGPQQQPGLRGIALTENAVDDGSAPLSLLAANQSRAVEIIEGRVAGAFLFVGSQPFYGFLVIAQLDLAIGEEPGSLPVWR